MRFQLRHSRIWTVAIAVAMVGGFLSAGPVFAGPTNKTQICHFKRDAGEWQKKTVTLRGEGKHLVRHDDAVPGGVTSQTFTQLDEDCLVPCADKYLPDEICEETIDSCTFYVAFAGSDSCEAYCANLGGECLGAINDTEDSCTNPGVEDPDCSRSVGDMICQCSR